MELHPLHVTLYTTWDFRFLSKGDFRVGKQVLSFLVVKMIWISHIFFSLLAKFCVIFPLYWTKNLGLGSLFLRILTFKMLFILGWFFCDLFLRYYFIQRLINNTGGPLSWVLIFSPDLLIFLKSYIKGLPVIGNTFYSFTFIPICFNFFLLFRSWQNFEVTCTRIFFEFQRSNFLYLN